MALSAADKKNFETIRKAAKAGHLALMECADSATGEVVAVICAVNEVDGEYQMVPVAKLFNGNPYEQLLSPMQIDEAKAG